VTVANDPDGLEAQGQKLRDIGAEIDTAVGQMEEKAKSMPSCFGNGEIGKVMQEHHAEVLASALDVYRVAALEIQSAGDDLKDFAERWRIADEAASTDFGRIKGRMDGD
jgi:hypothetical protein